MDKTETANSWGDSWQGEARVTYIKDFPSQQMERHILLYLRWRVAGRVVVERPTQTCWKLQTKKLLMAHKTLGRKNFIKHWQCTYWRMICQNIDILISTSGIGWYSTWWSPCTRLNTVHILHVKLLYCFYSTKKIKKGWLCNNTHQRSRPMFKYNYALSSSHWHSGSCVSRCSCTPQQHWFVPPTSSWSQCTQDTPPDASIVISCINLHKLSFLPSIAHTWAEYICSVLVTATHLRFL